MPIIRKGRKKTKASYNPDVKEYKRTSDDIKRLNNGQSIYMTTYSVDKKNNNINDIYALLNNKSYGMGKNQHFKNSTLKLNINFKGVGWRSMSSYELAGRHFETSEEYESLSGGKSSEILGFSIHFIV